MSENINEVRERLGYLAVIMGAQHAADLRALLADHARLKAVSQTLESALAGLTGFVATDVLESCNGSKCREPWCAGCCGEESAEQSAGKARIALETARSALAQAVQS